jgi:hypothetical protein
MERCAAAGPSHPIGLEMQMLGCWDVGIGSRRSFEYEMLAVHHLSMLQGAGDRSTRGSFFSSWHGYGEKSVVGSHRKPHGSLCVSATFFSPLSWQMLAEVHASYESAE